MKLRTFWRDLWATLRMLQRQPRRPQPERPRVFRVEMSPRARWAIAFHLDGELHVWYTDKEEQARSFARNLETYGAENAECAA